jgi:hypothetical protein
LSGFDLALTWACSYSLVAHECSLSGRLEPSITVRRIEEEETMSVSEAFRGVVDESVESMELAPGKAFATGLATMLRDPLIEQSRKEGR